MNSESKTNAAIAAALQSRGDKAQADFDSDLAALSEHGARQLQWADGTFAAAWGAEVFGKMRKALLNEETNEAPEVRRARLVKFCTDRVLVLSRLPASSSSCSRLSEHAERQAYAQAAEILGGLA